VAPPLSESPIESPQTLRLPAPEIGQVLAAPRVTLIDLRSPAEFSEDQLPGAINVPLFDDLERAVVGTLYKQATPEQAFAAGLVRVRGRIIDLVQAIASTAGVRLDAGAALERMEALARGGQRALEGRLQLASVEELPADALVLHCWRGGLRSQSVTALLRCLGLPAYVLNGGYRAYRREVTRRLEQARWPRSYVLRGLTGVGKSEVLRAVERLAPGSTLDLEALAQHRSSVLGMVGLQPVSQKAFDSALALQLQGAAYSPGRALDRRAWMLVEGESRKVGDVTLPSSLWANLNAGRSLELTAPLAVRVEKLIADYLRTPEVRPQLASQLAFIEERLGAKQYAGQLVALLEARREPELVSLLLEQYYDPLYRHSEARQNYAAQFDASDGEACARGVLDWIETQERQFS
jgi:tRNA 2-selenouridine synthase